MSRSTDGIHRDPLWWYGDHLHQTRYIEHLESGGSHEVALRAIRISLEDLETLIPHRDVLSDGERDSLDHSLGRMRKALGIRETGEPQ